MYCIILITMNAEEIVMPIQQQKQKVVEPEIDPKALLTNVPIVNENVALNVMVSYLNLAQKRGAFGIDESAKIWECIRMFQKPVSMN